MMVILRYNLLYHLGIKETTLGELMKGATINTAVAHYKIPILKELPVFREQKKWITRKSYFPTNSKKSAPNPNVKPFKSYEHDQQFGLYICHTGNALIDSRFVLPVISREDSKSKNEIAFTNFGNSSNSLTNMSFPHGKLICLIQSKFTKVNNYFTKTYEETFEALSNFLENEDNFDKDHCSYFAQFEHIIYCLKTNNKLSDENEYSKRVTSSKEDFILIARENMADFAPIYSDYFSLISENPNTI